MSELLKPGGRILAQEPVCGAYADLPSSDPPVPARARFQQIMWSVIERAGASPQIGTHLGQACADAGLEELSQRGLFLLSGPRDAHALLQTELQTLRGSEKALVEFGVATVDEIHALVAEYEAAQALTSPTG